MMEKEPPKFTKGDRVRLTWNDYPQEGRIALTSPNGRSLAIEFDAAGAVLPLMWNGRRFVTLVAGVAVDLERVEHADKH